MLKQRIITAAVMTLVILPLLWFSYLPYLMESVIAVLVAVATYELFHACIGKIDSPAGMIFLAVTALAATILQFLTLPHYAILLGVFWVLAIGLFAYFMPRISAFSISGYPLAILLSLVTAFFFKSVPELCHMEHGNWYILLCLATSISTEMTGFFVGRAYGRHKLAPTLSPNKSIEGAVSACILPPLFLSFVIFILQFTCLLTVRWGYLFLYLILGTVVTQFGDLAFSLIKRATGIKDFGKILPGHGGILDRFDAQCFLTPYTFLFLTVAKAFIIW